MRTEAPTVLKDGWEWVPVGDAITPGMWFWDNIAFVESTYDQRDKRLPTEGIVHYPFHYAREISKEVAACELNESCQMSLGNEAPPS